MELKRKIFSSFSVTGTFILKLILVLGCLVFLNFAALHLQFRWDFSEGDVHSLAESTKEILRQLTKPAEITLVTSTVSEPAEQLLSLFQHKQPLLSYKFLDPEDVAAKTLEPSIRHKNVVIVEIEGRRRFLYSLNEQVLAGALLQLTKGGDKRILFSAGHGELDIMAQDHKGLSAAEVLLTSAGYNVVQRPLTPSELADAAVLVIAAPQTDLTDDEVAKVAEFVRNGGGLLMMLNPPPASGLEQLLAAFNLEAATDFVVELHRTYRYKGFGPSTIYAAFNPEHPLSQRLNQKVILPGVRSLGISNDDDKNLVVLSKSSPNSWGETDLHSKELTWDKNVDRPGPRNLIIASSEPETSLTADGRFLISGTAEFAANRYINTVGNRLFFEAAVSWLAGDLNYPLIPAKEPHKALQISESQFRILFMISVVAIPGLAALAGIAVLVRRTRQNN